MGSSCYLLTISSWSRIWEECLCWSPLWSSRVQRSACYLHEHSGGAWDNAKKYITGGGLGPSYVKGSEAHKNSVTGDTVGDPLKDTSGPALNIVMKLTAIISLVFGTAILEKSNPSGGPFWLK